MQLAWSGIGIVMPRMDGGRIPAHWACPCALRFGAGCTDCLLPRVFCIGRMQLAGGEGIGTDARCTKAKCIARSL
jgi:hypothetical protein